MARWPPTQSVVKLGKHHLLHGREAAAPFAGRTGPVPCKRLSPSRTASRGSVNLAGAAIARPPILAGDSPPAPSLWSARCERHSPGEVKYRWKARRSTPRRSTCCAPSLAWGPHRRTLRLPLPVAPPALQRHHVRLVLNPALGIYLNVDAGRAVHCSLRAMRCRKASLTRWVLSLHLSTDCTETPGRKV